jgi:hypothetical protein
VFALRNLANEEDAAVLALSAYSAALRRALEAPASLFFIHEAPILFEFDEIGALIGRLCANGAKAGIRVIISAQAPDTVYKSPSSAKIFQNLSTRLIGRVQPTAVDSFERILKYPRSIISRNASESFFPKREGIYSQWLLDHNGIYTYCRYYPAFAQLAAVANNPDEQATRDLVLRYSSDFYNWFCTGSSGGGWRPTVLSAARIAKIRSRFSLRASTVALPVFTKAVGSLPNLLLNFQGELTPRHCFR